MCIYTYTTLHYIALHCIAFHPLGIPLHCIVCRSIRYFILLYRTLYTLHYITSHYVLSLYTIYHMVWYYMIWYDMIYDIWYDIWYDWICILCNIHIHNHLYMIKYDYFHVPFISIFQVGTMHRGARRSCGPLVQRGSLRFRRGSSRVLYIHGTGVIMGNMWYHIMIFDFLPLCFPRYNTI